MTKEGRNPNVEGMKEGRGRSMLPLIIILSSFVIRASSIPRPSFVIWPSSFAIPPAAGVLTRC